MSTTIRIFNMKNGVKKYLTEKASLQSIDLAAGRCIDEHRWCIMHTTVWAYIEITSFLKILKKYIYIERYVLKGYLEKKNVSFYALISNKTANLTPKERKIDMRFYRFIANFSPYNAAGMLRFLQARFGFLSSFGQMLFFYSRFSSSSNSHTLSFSHSNVYQWLSLMLPNKDTTKSKKHKSHICRNENSRKRKGQLFEYLNIRALSLIVVLKGFIPMNKRSRFTNLDLALFRIDIKANTNFFRCIFFPIIFNSMVVFSLSSTFFLAVIFYEDTLLLETISRSIRAMACMCFLTVGGIIPCHCWMTLSHRRSGQ